MAAFMSYQLIRASARQLPLADESVQCVVTSPPYWGLRKYDGEQGEQPFGLEPSLKLYVEHTIEMLRELRRVLKPDGVVFYNIGDSYAGGGNYRGITSENTLTAKQASNRGATGVHQELGALGKDTGSAKAKDLCLIPQRIAIAAQEDGWWVRTDVIWHKPNPMPESVRDRFTDAYEHILMLTRSSRYYWDANACQEPATHAGKVVKLGAKSLSRGQATALNVAASGNGKAKEVLVRETRNMRNVWTFSTQPFKGAHFATFPEEIPRRCIRAATKPGDTVLDPFCGSGTVGRVALELGRNFIGVDLAYQGLAKQRIEAVRQGVIF
jgi:DNA modification methylase